MCAVHGSERVGVRSISRIAESYIGRGDRHNDIALNTLHYITFDLGLITFDEDLRLVCAPSLCDHYTNETVSLNFKNIDGRPLALPAEAAGPKANYLEWHREHVFGR